MTEEAKIMWRDTMSDSMPLIYTPMNTWIKTSNQLPPFDQTVLGLNSGGVRVVMFEPFKEKEYFVTNKGDDGCGCCDSFDENITHWMLLPELPREE